MVGWREKLDFDRFRNIGPSDYRYIALPIMGANVRTIDTAHCRRPFSRADGGFGRGCHSP